MFQKPSVKWLSFLLAVVMIVGMLPLSAFAAGSVTTYQEFLSALKVLEVYADSYAATSGKDSGELVLNFIRTGVERYQTGTWETLAGEEITGFTEYVESQDAANGTNAMDLRDIIIDDFKLPNGNPSDFGHMFGTMNISYVASAIQSDDLSGWAGDVCDLIYYSAFRETVPAGTVDEMAAYILEKCFGVNADDAFGWDDFYGDMDAYYFISEYAKGTGKFSELMESYYTADLDDSDRAAYFVNNRFPGKSTKDQVREAVYDAYRTNVGIQVLEADRDISDYTELRKAACYAFADYLFAQADGRLVGGDAGDDGDELPTNGYYSVFSSTSSILAPGITQEINYAMSVDGKQMVYYIATVDVSRDDVTIMANYKDNDPSKGWGMQRVEDQVAALVKNNSDVENFTPVVAINGDGFNTSTGQPGGLLVMEGIEWHPVDGDGFFAILKDGTAMIGTKAEYEAYKDQIQEAIGAFGATLIKDGEISINKSSTYYTTRASRTAIGIKADGSVVMMVLDGRQEPFSCGGSMEEIAQIMYEAGCVHAVNLDGGGSTTYMSKAEGSDSIKVVNRPSDGYARSVAATLVAVSTAKSSDEFDRAIIESEYDYLTVGTSIQINAIGVNNIGSSAVIPEGAYWTVSDETIGTITADGVFTALANGDVVVNFIVNDEVVGTKELHVVIPDSLEVDGGKVNAIFGVPTEISLIAYYDSNVVKINVNDIMFVLMDSSLNEILDESAGVFNGFMFTGNEERGLRNMNAVAILISNPDIGAVAPIAMYKSDEAYFDFDNATSGNRKFAWIRDVLNATTTDGINYTIVDPNGDIAVEYTFALDMSTIEIPAQLADIAFMLPGSDTSNATSAFNYLLQLAERVSILTEVKIEAQFDADVDVDISDLQVINDYFTLTSATLDESNKLTIICNWIDRTQAIDPATANPVCILTGLKATPKTDATWTDDELVVVNSGDVSYDIYLRASSLYSFAQKEENQQKYGLYPYSTDETGWEGGTESGAHFSDSYVDFQDSFIIDRAMRQGWYTIDGKDYYFVDHVALTGIHLIPGKNDSSLEIFYEFDETGACLGTVNGVFAYNDGLCYAVQGVPTTGWVATDDGDGNQVDYYFDPVTGMAVDGVQTIHGYTYTFTNYILTRGDFVTDSTGSRYRWAGVWVHGKWFEVDGKTYHTARYKYYVTTGYANVIGPDLERGYYLFDDNGVFQEDYTGLWHVGEDTYLIENGHRNDNPGLVYLDGYYYYFASNAKAVKNCTYWPTLTNGLLPVAAYQFDEQGRMINPPVVNPDDGESPDLLNGIVEDNGVYYYYENGLLKSGAGVIKLTDDEGVEFYIYVRSNGQLAIGSYWVTTTNGLLEQGIYDFGDNGRYYPVTDETPDVPVDPEEPETPALKNGIYKEGDNYYYYVDGVTDPTMGVVKLADADGRTFYIYVRSSTGTLATGVYWPTTRNGLLPMGAYDFGTDGRYYPAVVTPDPEEPETPVEPEEPDEVKDGIYEENGKFYYYENGVCDPTAGLVKLTDEEGKTFYIYVRSSTGAMVTGRYWPTVTNDLLAPGWYDFGEDGRYYPAE